jgi:hypothetical protein
MAEASALKQAMARATRPAAATLSTAGVKNSGAATNRFFTH